MDISKVSVFEHKVKYFGIRYFELLQQETQAIVTGCSGDLFLLPS